MNDLSATDRCVKCGLCLPHCPTFALTGNEADSPRGRISLMQALGKNDLQWSPGLFLHLDRCLHCGACEAMCPSRVPFGRLMDTARAVIEPRRKRSLMNRLVRNTGLWLVTSPAGIRVLGKLLVVYQKTGLQSLLGWVPLLPATARRLNRLLPVMQPAGTKEAPINSSYRRRPASNSLKPLDSGIRQNDGKRINQSFPDKHRGEVGLFGSCMGSTFDQLTLSAARQLLQRLGYRVSSPARHACCGALHQHNGAPNTARQLADMIPGIFSDRNTPILVTASGCTAHLLDYKTLYPDTPAATFAERVSDIMHFLLESGRGDMQFAEPEQKVAVYIPCTHRNNLKQHQDVMDVLKWIPGPEPVLINPDGGCCGAAGSYMLSQPEQSERLANPVVERILESGAGLVLTTNIGCSIQLQAALKQRAAAVEVLHPVVLLERLLYVVP